MTDNAPNPEPTSSDGHTSNGQFAPGNTCGHGNPYARQCAMLRKVIHEVVTEDQMRDLCADIFLRAQRGDMAAAKLIFQYAIGKPHPAPDPDTLDAHELRTLQANSLTPAAFEPMKDSLPLEPILSLMPLVHDCRAQTLAQGLTEGLAQLDEQDRRRAARVESKAERKRRRREERAKARQNAATAPSPTASNGSGPPSPTASNGKPPASFIQRWLRGES